MQMRCRWGQSFGVRWLGGSGKPDPLIYAGMPDPLIYEEWSEGMRRVVRQKSGALNICHLLYL